jgi:predicted Rossmann-fold nucleotide-binding protein
MEAHKLFVPRRIGVCGSSKDLSEEAVSFCKAVGEELGKEDNVVIVSGGTKKRKDATGENNLAADWYIVDAARRAIEQNSSPERIAERIETVVSRDPKAEYFDIGSKTMSRGKTSQARRFSFVRGLDALFAVAGRGGTAQELALAMELGIPLLSVPLFDGEAKRFWDDYESDFKRALRLDDAAFERWRVPAITAEQLQPLAVEMVGALLASIPRRCFVIMPFAEDFAALYDFVIERAILCNGDRPIRLDRTAVPGDAGRQINDGIKSCDYAIAVLDGLRANVLYELGIAHGCDKPTILLNRTGSLGDAARLPFDLSMKQRLEYQTVEASLVERLKDALAKLPSRRG